jgi:hypothetical protein
MADKSESWSREVYSSSVKSMAYDPQSQELSVTWINGRTSVYSGVPHDLAHQVSTAHSVGKALSEQVKPHYAHRYA